MLRAELEEHDALKKKGGLSAKQRVAEAGNNDAVAKLKWLQQKNKMMREHIGMLLRTKNQVQKEKRTYEAHKIREELKVTQADITAQRSKVAIIKAQKELAGNREAEEGAKTKRLLRKVKQAEAALTKP